MKVWTPALQIVQRRVEQQVMNAANPRCGSRITAIDGDQAEIRKVDDHHVTCAKFVKAVYALHNVANDLIRIHRLVERVSAVIVGPGTDHIERTSCGLSDAKSQSKELYLALQPRRRKSARRLIHVWRSC